MEKSLLELQGETRYLSWSGDEYFIKNSLLMCYISTDQFSKLKLRIDIHQTAKDLFTSVTIFQGPGPLKFLRDDIEQQCKDGGFKINLITRDTLKFRSKDPADAHLLQFGKLLVKMKSMKSVLDDPFGMMVHDMSLGDICSTYDSTHIYKKNPANWAHKAKSKKENELSGRENLPLSNKNGIINRAKIRQTVQLPAKKSMAYAHLPKKDIFNANSIHRDIKVLDKNSSKTTLPKHIRFASDTCDASTPSSQLDKRLVSSVPLSLKEPTSNVMTTSTPERRGSQFYGNRSTTCTPQHNLNLIRSPRSSNTLQKRASSLNAAASLTKKSCISPNRSENKENQSQSTANHHLNQEGFKNIGNTCYMNADLQALFHTESFSEDMMATFNEIQSDLDQSNSFRAIGELLIERNNSFSEHSEDHYETLLMHVKDAVDLSCKNFLGYHMQDVQEFHNKILCIMKEEIAMAIGKSGKDDLINPVDSYFKMTLDDTMICLECGNVVKKSQVAYDITLQIPKTAGSLQSALKTNFAGELREFNCPKCSHNQSKTKTTISCLPKILTIFLKRYKFSENQVVKDETLVDVPDLLMLQEFVEKQGHKLLESDCQSKESTECCFVIPNVLNQDLQMGGGDHQENSVGDSSSFGDNQHENMIRNVQQSYQLKSAVCYHGDATTGHYVCYGIDIPKQRYKLFDDKNVSEVSKKEVSTVLKEHGYLFIYEKVTTSNKVIMQDGSYKK